jgi:hypothetical protein
MNELEANIVIIAILCITIMVLSFISWSKK